MIGMKRQHRDYILIIVALFIPMYLSLAFVHENVNEEKTKKELTYLNNQIQSLYDENQFTNAINMSYKALNTVSSEQAPKQYAELYVILGKSYYSLSKNNDSTPYQKEANLTKSIESYEEVLKIYDIDSYPVEFAFTKALVGDSYRDIALLQVNNTIKGDYNWKSYTAYGDSLKIITAEKYPLEYSEIIKKRQEVLQTPYQLAPDNPMRFGDIMVSVS